MSANSGSDSEPKSEIKERTPPPPPRKLKQSVLNFFPASSNSDSTPSRSSSSGSEVDAGASSPSPGVYFKKYVFLNLSRVI